MSKNASTAVPGINRRHALTAGAAVAAATAVPVLAATPAFSPEFREWFALASAWDQALSEEEVWERSHPNASKEEEQRSSPLSILIARLTAKEEEIHARKVRSWADVGELGIIALFWTDTSIEQGEDPAVVSQFALARDVAVNDEYHDARSAARLIQAVATLAMGGTNV